MKGMKIWAYAKDQNGEYIKDPYKQDGLKFFSIWDVLRMKNNDIHNYNKLSFFSTAYNECKRLQLYPVQRENSFFRYENKDVETINNPKGLNKSLLRKLVIQKLSEITQIKFLLNNKHILLHT